MIHRKDNENIGKFPSLSKARDRHLVGHLNGPSWFEIQTRTACCVIGVIGKKALLQ